MSTRARIERSANAICSAAMAAAVAAQQSAAMCEGELYPPLVGLRQASARWSLRPATAGHVRPATDVGPRGVRTRSSVSSGCDDGYNDVCSSY